MRLFDKYKFALKDICLNDTQGFLAESKSSKRIKFVSMSPKNFWQNPNTLYELN